MCAYRVNIEKRYRTAKISNKYIKYTLRSFDEKICLAQSYWKQVFGVLAHSYTVKSNNDIETTIPIHL